MIEQSASLKSAAESRAANLADRLVPYTLAGSLFPNNINGAHHAMIFPKL